MRKWLQRWDDSLTPAERYRLQELEPKRAWDDARAELKVRAAVVAALVLIGALMSYCPGVAW